MLSCLVLYETGYCRTKRLWFGLRGQTISLDLCVTWLVGHERRSLSVTVPMTLKTVPSSRSAAISYTINGCYAAAAHLIVCTARVFTLQRKRAGGLVCVRWWPISFQILLSVVFNRTAFLKDHFNIGPSKLLIIIIIIIITIKRKKKFQKCTFIDKGQRGKCFSTT